MVGDDGGSSDDDNDDDSGCSSDDDAIDDDDDSSSGGGDDDDAIILWLGHPYASYSTYQDDCYPYVYKYACIHVYRDSKRGWCFDCRCRDETVWVWR